jgi:transcriptional regulator GlxA family with amidase domain
LVVVMQRAGGQSQFCPYISTYADISSPLAMAQRHVLSNLQDRLSLEELAKASQMSVRNFSRLFHKELGVTPSEFVERARVDAARSMLESGRTPLKTIAHACGFRTPGRMRNAFIRCLGVTPQHYRLSFNA